MARIFRCFLFQRRPAPDLRRGKRAGFWIWNWALLLAAALGLGLLSLSLAPGNYGWVIFFDYCASPVLLCLNLLPPMLLAAALYGILGRPWLAQLSKYFMVDYDDAGSIGKRYRRQDEIGTPYCVTVDFQTVGSDTEEADHAVTIRDRDTMEQVRIPIDQLKAWLDEKLAY